MNSEMSTILEYTLDFVFKNLNKSDQEELYKILDRKLFDKSETSAVLYEENAALKVQIEDLEEKLAYEKSVWSPDDILRNEG